MLALISGRCFAMASTCAARGSTCLYSSSRASDIMPASHHKPCTSYYCLSPSQVGQRARVTSQGRQQPMHRGYAAVFAASGGDAPTSSLVDRLKSDMKGAMKAKDQARLDAIRFLNAAIKQREIELREGGGPMNDQEVIKVIQKLVKQRKDSIESYRAGGREDLVAKEQTELGLLEGYLPAMMTPGEVEAVVEAVIAELGVTGTKAMGTVMKTVMARTGGRADNKTVSDLAKARLK